MSLLGGRWSRHLSCLPLSRRGTATLFLIMSTSSTVTPYVGLTMLGSCCSTPGIFRTALDDNSAYRALCRVKSMTDCSLGRPSSWLLHGLVTFTVGVKFVGCSTEAGHRPKLARLSLRGVIRMWVHCARILATQREEL